MIKEEAQQSLIPIYYCFNPFCSDKNNRKFKNEDRHFLREQCKKWIAEESVLTASYEPIQAKFINKLSIDFQNHPLKAFQVLGQLRHSDWGKVLDVEQSKVKRQINRAIQIQFEGVRQTMRRLLDNASFFDNACLITKTHADPSSLLNQFYEGHLQQFNALQSKVLFKRMQLKEGIADIKEQVKKIFNFIIEDQSNSSGIITHQEQRNFHEYVFEQTSQYYNKLVMLAGALKKSIPMYQVQDQKFVLKCCQCDRAIRMSVDQKNKIPVKKYLAEQILTHIYCSHYEEAAFAYTKKISKSYLKAITFEDFLQASKKSKRVILVDPQSGPNYEQQYMPSQKMGQCYTVQVVSMKNVAMARGHHILVQNNHSIDYLIAILSYVCTQRDQNVEIVTKRVTLKSGIQHLLWCQVTKKEE